ncbi:hypothetical protein NDU88_004748 [Pleurodeles waltl]|uniref:Uncharacterized protein n=1 Tax=Pleurodeles waltl TaxID=8319 RepID=A0AAV7TUI9_PLEWA|nr:hypothetical protein NDU88_004748 [Pleurodeles waltl]
MEVGEYPSAGSCLHKNSAPSKAAAASPSTCGNNAPKYLTHELPTKMRPYRRSRLEKRYRGEVKAEKSAELTRVELSHAVPARVRLGNAAVHSARSGRSL